MGIAGKRQNEQGSDEVRRAGLKSLAGHSLPMSGLDPHKTTMMDP